MFFFSNSLAIAKKGGNGVTRRHGVTLQKRRGDLRGTASGWDVQPGGIGVAAIRGRPTRRAGRQSEATVGRTIGHGGRVWRAGWPRTARRLSAARPG